VKTVFSAGMSLQRSLSSSILWRGIYFVAVALVNVVASRLLGAETSGWLFYFFTVGALVVLVVSLSTETAFSYFVSKQIITFQQAAHAALYWALFSGIVQIFCMYLLLNFLPPIAILTQTQMFAYGAMYVVGNTVITVFNQLFITQHQYKVPQQWLAGINFLLIACFFLAANKATVIALYCWFYLLQAAVLAVLFFTTNNIPLRFSVRISRATLVAMFRYAGVVMAGNAVFFLVYRIDYFFIHKYTVPTADVGNYLQASKLGQLLLVIPQIMASVLFPATAQQVDSDTVKPAIFCIARLVFQLCLLLAIILYFFGEVFFTRVLGQSFNSTHTYLLLLLPGIFSLCVLALFSAYLSGKGRVQINLLAAVAALLVAIGLNMWLVPRWGADGAAVASVGSYWINMLISFWVIHYYFSLPKNWWKPQKADYFWLFHFIKL
jgi:O-antigen/teichoic acid export membrane protein